MYGLRFLASAVVVLAAMVGASPVANANKELAETLFSAVERATIANYYRDAGQETTRGKGAGKNKGKKGRGVGSRGLPPGLAGRQALPPGIAKRQLPRALTSQLPPAPTGFERAIVDNDLVLLEIGTQIVHDIITDIVTK